MINQTVMEFNCIQTEADMRDNSDLERRKAEETLFGEMELFIQDNLKTDSCKERGFIDFQMEKFMKDSLEKTKDTEEESTFHL